MSFSSHDETFSSLNSSISKYSFEAHLRFVRESRTLIGPFDMSKRLEKKLGAQLGNRQPSASPLRALGITLDLSRDYVVPSQLLAGGEMSTRRGVTKTDFGSRERQEASTEGNVTVAPKVLRKPIVVKSSRKRKAKTSSSMIEEEETAWPGKRAAVLEGDVLLGGLMMVSAQLGVATTTSRWCFVLLTYCT